MVKSSLPLFLGEDNFGLYELSDPTQYLVDGEETSTKLIV